MKILFTTFAYYPETSGVPVVVQYLAEGLMRCGHDVTVITSCYKKNLLSNEIINGVKVVRFAFGQSIYKTYVGEYKEYVEFVLKYPKDVLILECIQCYTTDILLPFLKDFKCKILLHSHGGPGINMHPFSWENDIVHTIGHTHNWLRWKKYYRQTLPKAAKYIDAAICLSVCASDLGYMNNIMRKVFVLENAANEIFFDEKYYKIDTSDILRIQSDEYILCIANYIPNKRQLDIVKAFVELKNPNCALVMIGSKKNNYYHKVCSFANYLSNINKKEIKLLTGIDRKYFPSIISKAKFFVMASKHEEYPVSLIEAMACGTPFLSTNVGCSRILPGGITVNNKTDLGVFMDFLDKSPDVLLKLGFFGKEYAARYNTLNSVVNHLESIILSL